MKFLILGAGAVGGYFGARLLQCGADVTFLVRPTRAELLRKSGLKIVSPKGDAYLQVNVVSDATEGGPYDLAILSCKAYDLNSAIDALAPAIGADTAIVLLPGEVFVELGIAIKRRSPFANTIVIELANENCAYVPTKEAFTQGAYEVANSRIAAGGGERLVEEAVALLKELADAKP